MRIAVFGLPNQVIHALETLRSTDHTIVAVIPAAPAHPAHAPVVQYAKNNLLPCLYFETSPQEPAFLEAFRTTAPEVAFVCGFDKLIPPELLTIPRHGFINFHPALLPDYRGGNAYFYMLLNGETNAGVTAHFMDEHFDTGDIIYQERFALSPQETMGTLANKAEGIAAQLALRIANELSAGQPLPRTPQPDGTFKKAASVIPERGDTRIRWDLPAITLERFVRACNPFYGAVTTFRTKPFIMLQGEVLAQTSATDAPGTIVQCDDKEIVIQTGNGQYRPTVVQYDNYLIGTTEQFIREMQPLRGERLI